MTKTMTNANKKLRDLKKKIKAQKAKIKTMNNVRSKAGLKRVTKATLKKSKAKTYKPSSKARVLKSDNYQTPKSRKSLSADKKRKALPPGRRISKSGTKYTEHRQNRSDKKGKKV